MPNSFILSEDDRNWFDQFFKSKEFAEALGIVWGYGSEIIASHSFVIRCADYATVERFYKLVRKTRSVYSRVAYIQGDKNKPYDQWVCSMSLKHPFVEKIKAMGWVPIVKEDRSYPSGEFDEEVFIKTFIKLHHNIGTIYEKKIDYVKPRLKIHGTKNVLDRISQYLASQLGVGKKKVQNIGNTSRTKIIYYHSKKEIPQILSFVNAFDSLEKFKKFDLGYASNKNKKHG